MAATPKPTPKAKPKTLNDFLKEGKRPPSKNKKIPSEADVIIKGYNDKKTIAKEKLKADMKSGKMKPLESGMTGAMVAKVAGKVISKVASKANAKSTAKALKAAKGPSLAKGINKTNASSGSVSRRIVKSQAETNMILGSSRKEAFSKAAQKIDASNATAKKQAQRILDAEKAKKILSKAKADKPYKQIKSK